MSKKSILVTIVCLLLYTSNAWAGGDRFSAPLWLECILILIYYFPAIFFVGINVRVLLGIYSARFSLKPALLIASIIVNTIALVECVRYIMDDFGLFSEFDHHGPWYQPLSDIYSNELRLDYANAVQDVWLMLLVIVTTLSLIAYYIILLWRRLRQRGSA